MFLIDWVLTSPLTVFHLYWGLFVSRHSICKMQNFNTIDQWIWNYDGNSPRMYLYATCICQKETHTLVMRFDMISICIPFSVSTFGFLTHGNIAHCCNVVTFNYNQTIYSTDIINIKGNISKLLWNIPVTIVRQHSTCIDLHLSPDFPFSSGWISVFLIYVIYVIVCAGLRVK